MHALLLFVYLIEQVEFSRLLEGRNWGGGGPVRRLTVKNNPIETLLLADVDLLYFHRGQPQHRELHALYLHYP